MSESFVLERQPIRVASLERQGFVQRPGKNYLVGSPREGPGGHREGAHDVDHDRHGRGFDQLGNAEESSVHPVMVAHALPVPIPARRRTALLCPARLPR